MNHLVPLDLQGDEDLASIFQSCPGFFSGELLPHLCFG